MAQIRRQRYDSMIGLRALRLMPTGRGAGARLAGLPEWDGRCWFPEKDNRGRLVGYRPYENAEVTFEASLSLYDMARGNFEGRVGEQMRDDPEDPPAVKADILLQGDPQTRVMATAKPWGFRGTAAMVQQAVALQARAQLYRRG